VLFSSGAAAKEDFSERFSDCIYPIVLFGLDETRSGTNNGKGG
jgi:hypothetical protein